MARSEWVGTEFRVAEGAVFGAVAFRPVGTVGDWGGLIGGDTFTFSERMAELYDPEVWLAMGVVEVVGRRRTAGAPESIFAAAALPETPEEESPKVEAARGGDVPESGPEVEVADGE